MTWSDLSLEKCVQRQLTKELETEGQKLWARYINTRTEFLDEVLPWIAKHGGGLTDHGPNHIVDVIDNAALLLGYRNVHSKDPGSEPLHDFDAYEMLVLLCGLLVHDVGNIYGRDRHNQKIDEVWSKMPSWQTWEANERGLIVKAARAHTGRGLDGTKDIIKDLTVSPHYFLKKPVRLAQISAVIRLADELAEGPQRTSDFLVKENLIEAESQIYHHYANVTRVSIDRNSGRIALTYDISVDNGNYPGDRKAKEAFFKSLLGVIDSRAAKLNRERQYARHYAEILHPFRETSISLTFHQSDSPIDLSLMPLILNDINASSDVKNLLATLDANYNIDKIVGRIMGAESGEN